MLERIISWSLRHRIAVLVQHAEQFGHRQLVLEFRARDADEARLVLWRPEGLRRQEAKRLP